MTTLLQVFPTSIYYEEDVLSKDDHLNLIKNCYNVKKQIPSGGENWHCHVYNTFNTHDISKDLNFDKITKIVQQHIDHFVSLHESNYPYKIQEGWLNMYSEKQYQEYHIHAGFTFSAVYYVKMPAGAGNIWFENPVMDMLPIKRMSSINSINAQDWYISPKENCLVIFRSYLRHMVEAGSNLEDRISLAFNI
jgi:uncharacterized protein (TIGR02466 family)